MDWLEQWFGMNPDGGDGSIEVLILGAVGALVVALAVALHPSARRLLRLARERRIGHDERS